MEINPVIDRITIYPVKSLDGISLQKAKIGTGGCLEHDREFAICDSNGKFVNGKSNALVHLLRSEIDFGNEIISFRHETADTWNSFHLKKDKAAIDEFLSAFFNMNVTLSRDTEGRFLDVPVKSGVTVLSNASLKDVAGWFNDMVIDDIDNDGIKDILVCGNSNDPAVMIGVYDATSALLLKGTGGGNFTAVPPVDDGLNVKGESRKMVYLKDKGKSTLIFLKNDAAAQVFMKK